MKTALRLMIIVFIYALCFSPVKAQDNFRAQKDSLLAIISKSEGEAKLKAYQDLIHFPYTPEQSDTLYMYIQQSIAEAKKHGNKDFEKVVRLNELIFLYNDGRSDLLMERLNSSVGFFQKNKYWYNYFFSYSLLVKDYMDRGSYDEALEIAKSMYDKSKEVDDLSGKIAATFSIGETYYMMSNRYEAETYFRETISLANGNDDFYYYIESSYANIIVMLVSFDKLDEALETLDKLKSEIERKEKEGESIINTMLSWELYYTRLIGIYIKMGDWDKAEHYCDVLEEMVLGGANRLFDIYRSRAEIYELQGTYPKALVAIDKAIDYASSFLDKTQYDEFLAQKARLLCKTGRGEDGYLLYEELLALNDSINTVEINAKLDELRTIYEVDKITAEKEIERQRVFIVTGICLFLLIVAGIYIIYARRLKAKNNALYEQIKELTRAEKAAEEYLINTQEDKLSDAMLLFRRISECVKTGKLFADPDMSRRKIADLLNSNETYIADAIRESTGETYSSYISNIRLQYTLELLQNKPVVTLDAVAVDSGHGSYSSFYRLFTKKYGITPSEYRKLSESQEVREED